jgi:hypothetical protein
VVGSLADFAEALADGIFADIVQAEAEARAALPAPVEPVPEATSAGPIAAATSIAGNGQPDAGDLDDPDIGVDLAAEMRRFSNPPTIAVEPGNGAAAVAAFVASLDGAQPDRVETVTADDLVRRGILTPDEAEAIHRQAERFASVPDATPTAGQDGSGGGEATQPSTNGRKRSRKPRTRS